MKRIALICAALLSGSSVTWAAGTLTQTVPPTDATTLLSAASATGSYVNWMGGATSWACWATAWNGAAAQLQYTPDSATNINIDGALLSANGGFSGIPLNQGSYRVLITGAPTSISCSLKRSE